MSHDEHMQQWRKIEAHQRSDGRQAASGLGLSLSAASPASFSMQFAPAWQKLGQFDHMLDAARQASRWQPEHHGARLRLVECLIYCAETGLAIEELATLESTQVAPDTLQAIAQMYLRCARITDAARCHEKAVTLQPGFAPYLFNLASSCVALGEHQRAEALFDAVIERDPEDTAAWLSRSLLRPATQASNNTSGMTALLSHLSPGDTAQIPLCYALAKEFEDMGEHEQSFAFLERGARARRASLAYRVENDIAAIDQIKKSFDARAMAGAADPDPDESSTFVLGLPRSGTTLVERILACHSEVGSLGEVNNFAFSLMKLAAGPGSKLDLIARSATLPFAKLGQLYRHSAASLCERRRVINKTPENYLFLGLIRLALPGARIVHLRRHPLDSCFAMYKTLFRMGYPFSYSLADLGRYYVAYHGLMTHWREVMPDGFFEVDYETLVLSPEAASRDLVAHCGLNWEDACLDVHRKTSPSATAGAAQVRRPLHQTSVQRWRAYSTQLEPLADFLTANGIDCT
ncbi:MAG: sulfotransferase [Pseudomonadota bacterium]